MEDPTWYFVNAVGGKRAFLVKLDVCNILFFQGTNDYIFYVSTQLFFLNSNIRCTTLTHAYHKTIESGRGRV